MKLLYCTDCHDVVRLFKETRQCECGAVGGRYLDQSAAEIFGDGIPMGILNNEFDSAIRDRTDEWPGVWFRGFVIPRQAQNLKRVDGPGA